MSKSMQEIKSLFDAFDVNTSKPEEDHDIIEDRMKLQALGADYMDLDEFGEDNG